MTDLKLALLTPRDTKWADGFRGLAALFVVSSHLVLGYAGWLLGPARDKHTPPAIYNLPFIRVFGEGLPWVTVFLVLTGFVNALKPIKQARAGRVDSALSGLASSCFRRTSRLVLPCTVATLFSWVICELGGYKIGAMVESAWMNSTSPLPSGSVAGALHTLFRGIYDTWARYNNGLDRNQWTMLWFLKGSMLLYVALLATVRATPRYRMLTFLGLFLYSWKACDTMAGLPIFGGALLAELSMEPIIIKFSNDRSLVNRLLPFSMVLLGWYLASYPKQRPEWQPWSNTLWHVGMAIFPKGAEVYSFWNIIGIMLVTFGVILSAQLQEMFSHPILLWLGAQSFPIYLIHGPLLRSFLNWMLYAFTAPIWYQEHDDKGNLIRVFPRFPIPPLWKFCIALPIFYFVLFNLANLWTLKVEPRCGSATKWLENIICGIPQESIYSEISLQESGRNHSPSNGRDSNSSNGALLPT